MTFLRRFLFFIYLFIGHSAQTVKIKSVPAKAKSPASSMPGPVKVIRQMGTSVMLSVTSVRTGEVSALCRRVNTKRTIADEDCMHRTLSVLVSCGYLHVF